MVPIYLPNIGENTIVVMNTELYTYKKIEIGRLTFITIGLDFFFTKNTIIPFQFV